MKRLTPIPLVLLLGTTTALADPTSEWFVRPYMGISQMSDVDGNAANVDSLSGTAALALDTGFTAGLGAGYRYNSRLAVELAWEYRSNDSETTIAGQSIFNEGNYASNSFFINAYYYFQKTDSWEPYVGAGLSWLQEVDVDLERNGVESSYSGSGDIGLQLIAGVNYRFANNWAMQGEFRYGTTSGIDLTGEEGAIGTIADIDYEPLTLQIGVVYRF